MDIIRLLFRMALQSKDLKGRFKETCPSLSPLVTLVARSAFQEPIGWEHYLPLSVPHRWHLLLSPLYDALDHTNHSFSVRIWSWQHVIIIISSYDDDHHHILIKQKDPTHARFLTRRGLKFIKYDILVCYSCHLMIIILSYGDHHVIIWWSSYHHITISYIIQTKILGHGLMITLKSRTRFGMSTKMQEMNASRPAIIFLLQNIQCYKLYKLFIKSYFSF